eukprot:g24701.t1
MFSKRIWYCEGIIQCCNNAGDKLKQGPWFLWLRPAASLTLAGAALTVTAAGHGPIGCPRARPDRRHCVAVGPLARRNSTRPRVRLR